MQNSSAYIKLSIIRNTQRTAQAVILAMAEKSILLYWHNGILRSEEGIR